MRVLVYVAFVGLLLDTATTLEETSLREELKQAAIKWEGDIPCQKSDCSCAFRSMGCCCGNQELQSLREHVSESFLNVSDRINQLQHEIRQVIEPVNVAFTAFLGDVNCIGPFDRNMSIPYDVISLNDGFGYNSGLGLFTAPVTGVYYFSVSVYSRMQWAGQHLFHKVQMMKNGEVQVSTWEDNRDDPEDSSHLALLLAMRQGDQVYAELLQERSLCGNIKGLNSFSGFLVYPTPDATKAY
ncbi:unnamed protein product [Knipowitschia caucasica]|uniref:C1q domain-containing protein n=1 Tax=Knipowitschia caucasica TaxID=637954 RepID=A0AAV2LH77_KNICA